MPAAQFSVRIGSTGKAELRNDFAEVRRDGVDTHEQLANAAEASAKRSVSAYNRAADEMVAADRRRAAAADKISAMAPSTGMQFAVQTAATTSGGLAGKSAQESASAMRELLKAEDDLTARTHALQMAYDPLYAAQFRYNQATKTANELLAAGRINTALHASVLAEEEAALKRVRDGIEGHSNALGFNRNQYLVATHAARGFAEQMLYTGNVEQALAAQAGHIASVLSLDEGGVAGALTKVRALLTPTTVGIGAAAVAVGIAAVSWYSYADAVDKLNAAAGGSGRLLGESGAQLEANAEAAAAAGNMTVSAARDIETSYLSVARSGDVLVGLTTLTKDYAAATGQDIPAAQSALQAAFGNTIVGAQDLAAKYGILTQAEVENIAKLVEHGDQEKAQALLLGYLQRAFGGAADQADVFSGSLSRLSSWASRAKASLGELLHEASNGQGILRLLGVDFNTGAGPNPARANAFAAQASAISRQYTGDDRDAIRTTVGTLQNAISGGGTPAQIKEWSEALQANKHALDTWIPSQQKANELADLSAKIAAAKTPAEKASLTAARERVELAGRVVTSADAEAQAVSRGAQAAASAGKHHNGHAEALQRDADSMRVAAEQSLKLADAYLEGGAAAIVAEARRKALTDATKRGIDTEAQAQRQLALEVAEGVANGAKSVAQLRDETEARRSILAAVADGSLYVGQMNQGLSDETALRPLLKLQLVAQGDALERLTRLIDTYRDALADAHSAEQKMGIRQAIAATDENIIRMRDASEFAGDLTGRGAIETARRAAEREAAERYGNLPESGQDRQDFVANKVAEARTKLTSDRATFAARAKQDHADSIALTQREMELVGANDNYRQAELDRLKQILDLKRAGLDPESEDGKAIIANVANLDRLNAKLQLIRDSMDEIRQLGDRFIDDLTNPDGSGLKGLLKDIESEFIKLAAINPLKNLLLGQNSPTLSSIFSLFGGSGSGVANPNSSFSAMIQGLADHNAAGTNDFGGGATWLAENGPELVTLPTGSRITSAAETRRMLAANDQVPVVQNFDLRGAVVTEELYSQMAAIGNAAATSGAAGGSQLAQRASARAARYSLRGR